MALCVAASAPAWAADAQKPLVHTLPSSMALSFENLRLPGKERMGLAGASYLVEVAPHWWVGPAVFGAATGQRGGLFTWGTEAQGRWRLGDSSWGVAAGLSVTAGGGASAPVGGGLMLRPHLDLVRDFGGWQLGVGASHVRFPSGDIRSSQIGLSIMVDDDFAFTMPGQGGRTTTYTGRGGLGADRVLGFFGRYSRSGGNGAGLGHVGVRIEQSLNPYWAATIEAAGAAQGGSDGYAEGLIGLRAQLPLFNNRIALGARGALGLAGGGAVSTGGGLVGKAALTGRLQLTPRLSLEAEAGRARARHGGFSSPYGLLALGFELDSPRSLFDLDPMRTVANMEWSVALQDHTRVQRKDGSTRGLQTMGLKLRRDLTEHLYVTGQAYGAYAGGAGAYSIGLVGLGATTRWDAYSAGIEALAGASGGGGVANEGGAVVQPMVWVGRDLGRHVRLKAGAGVIRSVKGKLDSPVAELSMAFEFGVP
jgi:hypothetical protein